MRLYDTFAADFCRGTVPPAVNSAILTQIPGIAIAQSGAKSKA
jgi:hypothetical protein